VTCPLRTMEQTYILWNWSNACLLDKLEYRHIWNFELLSSYRVVFSNFWQLNLFSAKIHGEWPLQFAIFPEANFRYSNFCSSSVRSMGRLGFRVGVSAGYSYYFSVSRKINTLVIREKFSRKIASIVNYILWIFTENNTLHFWQFSVTITTGCDLLPCFCTGWRYAAHHCHSSNQLLLQLRY